MKRLLKYEEEAKAMEAVTGKEKLLFGCDVEEWFQVENLRALFPHSSWSQVSSRIEASVDMLLEVMENAHATGTFFVLGWIAERFPKSIVRRIHEAGHEIASHGYRHQLLTELSESEIRKDLEHSKKLLEDITGASVIGYRAPAFSINKTALQLLSELGYVYDSSYNPSCISKRYGRLPELRANSKPVLELNGLLEVPMATLCFGKFHLPWSGGGYFRLYPYRLFRFGARLIAKKHGVCNFYIHPWELDSSFPVVSGLRPDFRFRHYLNLTKTKGRLERLLNEFSVSSIWSWLSRQSHLNAIEKKVLDLKAPFKSAIKKRNLNP